MFKKFFVTWIVVSAVIYYVFTQPLGNAFFIGLAAALLALVATFLERTILWLLGRQRRISDKGSTRRWLYIRAGLLATLLLVKLVWLPQFLISGGDLIENRARNDLFERRTYLINRTTHRSFGPSDQPFIVGGVFQTEWTIGTLSMTTAALTNMAFEFPETRSESLEVVGKLIERFLKQDIRDYERHYWGVDALEALDTENGQIGYLGHLNFMLGAYRMLGGDLRYDNLHRSITETLVRRMKNRKGFYLETFPDFIFIPDNMVVVASISLAQKALRRSDESLLTDWLTYSREHLLDPDTGLLVNWVDGNGAALGRTRGSYSAWNGFYLPLIDAEFANDQYQKIKKHLLVDLPFGAYALREYPHGVRGSGDIDSGPVIFGLSTSGTGFFVSGARYNKEADILYGLLFTAETVGSSVSYGGERSYVVAPLIGDAILLAMKTACVWDDRYLIATTSTDPHTSTP